LARGANPNIIALVKIVVIGGTGHIGTSLVPRLVQAGHSVVCIARGERAPYHQSAAWRSVEHVKADRAAEEAQGSFAKRVAGLGADVVIDLICFTEGSAQSLVASLEGRVSHFLLCGTIWVHGPSGTVPTLEDAPRKPVGEYGIQKAAIEAWLMRKARRDGFPATVVHPGHIVGPGWVPLNPQGNFNPAVYGVLQSGAPLSLPNLGMETVHHVHADDVAQVFCKAMERRSASIGESFHAVSPAAMTLRGYATEVSRWYGKEPDLRFAAWDEWKRTVSADDAAATWDHIAHSPCCSIEKARRLIGYEPRFTSIQAVFESLEWLQKENRP
jgi:nucleoside-diphosphate-sugar epimerase